jgi:acyl-coenzyme A synthetase/AMP-(fatty) acid ligase
MWLWDTLTARDRTSAWLHGPGTSVNLADLAHASCLRGSLEALRGCSVVIAAADQLAAALAIVELDGVARRIVLCPPDSAAEHLPHVVRISEADACVIDPSMADSVDVDVRSCVVATATLVASTAPRRLSCETEWILLTSGTTGAPKLVLHTLGSLTNAMARQARAPDSVVWSTFYDIRRYGGLQIFLRAMLSGSLVLSSPTESVPDFMTRVRSAGVTHISGTPTHWRRALMSGAASGISPGYVRLSGEVSDQAILDSLRAAYPHARIAHAFASTEAGVAFEVADGRAGFPADLVGAAGASVDLKVADDTLHIRSGGTATRYLGSQVPALKAEDGFVNTGDRVELRDGRYYFGGRSGGVINVGGLKVYPEEIEAVINSHPWVRMSLVKARRSPIVGAVVTAEVVVDPSEGVAGRGDRPAPELLVREIMDTCRRILAPHKVPAMIRIVPALQVSASGKLIRPNA